MKTHLDWSSYRDAGLGDAYADIPRHGGDFAKAVAVCINSRRCEETGRGLMCPSFRAVGDPLLSTGGRVRLLKQALNGDDPEQAWLDPELARAMALCVSCKGCKRECENAVDMALVKVEHLAQRHARGKTPLRGRIFAQTPRWLHARRGLLTRLIRMRNASSLLRWICAKGLGLDAGADWPQPAPRPFEEAGKGVSAVGEVDDARLEIALLVDTFSRHFEPEIAEAALEVLERAGYRVRLVRPEPGDAEPDRPLCCGRTYLAQGMVREARAEARRLVAALLPHVEAGRAVVGLEASCILGLRDDARALGLGADLDKVAGRTVLFEEFLAREQVGGRLSLRWKSEPGAPVLVHGHCHQKATGAMKSMRRVLKMIPGLEFQVLEAGCCGMAGTFGLEAEHGALSAKMAEAALMPALRENPSARVAANGFSCRQQMRNRGDGRPRHLALLLRDALAAPEEGGRGWRRSIPNDSIISMSPNE